MTFNQLVALEPAELIDVEAVENQMLPAKDKEAAMCTFNPGTRFPITRSDLFLPEDEWWGKPDSGIQNLRAEHVHVTLDAVEDGKVTLLVSGDPHGYLVEVDLEPATARELADQLVRAAAATSTG